MQADRTHRSKLLSPPALAVAGALLVLPLASGIAFAAEPKDGDAQLAFAAHRNDRYDDDRDKRRDHGRYDRGRRGHDDGRHDRRHRSDRYRSDRHRHDHHRYDHHRSDRYRSQRSDSRRHFDVPRSIGRDHFQHYRSYRYGRVYDARHRHYHEVYRFPYYSGYGVTYYPYAYCGGQFFARGVFGTRGPLFDIHIRF
jgi:hypothetical protein